MSGGGAQVAAAAIGGGSGLLSSLIGGIFQRNAQRSANNANIQIARDTNAQNYQIFREQNEFNKEQLNNYLQYNTPAAQRTRFEDAGINPYMALGNMQNGNSQSALTSANSAPMQATQVQPENGFANGIQNALLNAATVMSAVSDARLKNAEADKRNLENGVFAEDFANRMAEIRSKIGLNDSSRDKNKSEKNIFDFDFKFKNDTLANAMKLSDLSVQQGDALLRKTEAETNKLQIESDVMQWDLGLKKQYDESFLKYTISNLIADVAVKYQNISESNNRMHNDNIRTYNDSRRVGIEQQNANTNAFNAQTNRQAVQQQAKMITAEVAKIYSDKYGVDIDNHTRHAINQKVFEKLKAETNNISANTDWIPFNNVMNGIGSIVGSLGVGFGAGFLGRSMSKRPKIGFR